MDRRGGGRRHVRHRGGKPGGSLADIDPADRLSVVIDLTDRLSVVIDLTDKPHLLHSRIGQLCAADRARDARNRGVRGGRGTGG